MKWWGGDVSARVRKGVSRARVGRGMCCNVRHSVAPSTGQSDERLGGPRWCTGRRAAQSCHAFPVFDIRRPPDIVELHWGATDTHGTDTESQITQTIHRRRPLTTQADS